MPGGGEPRAVQIDVFGFVIIEKMVTIINDNHWTSCCTFYGRKQMWFLATRNAVYNEQNPIVKECECLQDAAPFHFTWSKKRKQAKKLLVTWTGKFSILLVSPLACISPIYLMGFDQLAKRYTYTVPSLVSSN